MRATLRYNSSATLSRGLEQQQQQQQGREQHPTITGHLSIACTAIVFISCQPTILTPLFMIEGTIRPYNDNERFGNGDIPLQ